MSLPATPQPFPTAGLGSPAQIAASIAQHREAAAQIRAQLAALPDMTDEAGHRSIVQLGIPGARGLTPGHLPTFAVRRMLQEELAREQAILARWQATLAQLGGG